MLQSGCYQSACSPLRTSQNSFQSKVVAFGSATAEYDSSLGNIKDICQGVAGGVNYSPGLHAEGVSAGRIPKVLAEAQLNFVQDLGMGACSCGVI